MADDHETLSRALGKATINVSIPADQREAFYAALARLKERDGGLFTSASALIVQAVLECAARLSGPDDGPHALHALPATRDVLHGEQAHAAPATRHGR
jgi:hypothetical protein